MPCSRARTFARIVGWTASLVIAPGIAWAQGPVPGSGYGATTDPSGIPYFHLRATDPSTGTMAYLTRTVGTTSTQVLAAPTTLARSKLYLLNPSGRLPGTTATDCWCSYGVPAVVGQGFLLAGYGDRVSEDIAAAIDQRPLFCIASAAVQINVGAIQQ